MTHTGESFIKPRRRVYFDIDGVYNAAIEPHIENTPQREKTGWLGEWSNSSISMEIFESVPAEWGDKFNLCWSHELVDAVNRIAEQENIEIVWLTTWRHRAPEYFAPLTNLRGQKWRVLSADWDRINDKNKIWWKHELLMNDLNDNPVERFAWFDDELVKNQDAIAWATRTNKAHLVIPETLTGVKRHEWESAELFMTN